MKRLFGRSGAVWDGAPGAAVLLVGKEGEILEACDAAPLLFGLRRSLLVGASLPALVRPADRAGLERALGMGGAVGRAEAGIVGGKRARFALRERPDGKRAVLVTEQAGADEERQALRAALEEARREAKARADLLADLSHEMRTPLNAVIGFAEAMKSETFGPLGHPKYAEYAGHIRASGGHLLDLVSSILDLAKIEADRFVLKRVAVDPAALAAECAGMMRLAAEKAGLRLTLSLADALPDCALDRLAVRQILLNLLSNAVKFTSDGEIALSVEARGGDVIFTVKDTGVGMSRAEIDKIGARFTAASGEGVRGAKGAGLGLALAFALAELHGGAIALKSAPGEGLAAIVRLPIKAPARLGRPNPFRESAERPAVLTQLDRIEAYKREREASAA